MNNEGIEDILISKEYNTKKKKGKGFFVMFFILLLMLIALIVAYSYLTKETVSSKELFVQNISKLNVNKLLDNAVYTNIVTRLQNEDSEVLSSVKFTTDLETEDLNDLDITKFKLDITNSNDTATKKSYLDAKLSYSGNEIFKADAISAENEIAISSNEILNQYVGVHKDKLKDVFGFDIDFEKLEEFKKLENIKFSEEEKNENIQKYLKLIIENIPEEKFSIQENIAIENASEDVAVTNYSLTLNQDELENVLIVALENLKTDKDIIKKLVEVKEETKNEEQAPEVNLEITPSEQPENVETTIPEEPAPEGSTPEEVVPEEPQEPEIPVIKINAVGTISITPSAVEEAQEEITQGEEVVSEEPTDVEESNEEILPSEETELNVIETTNIEELIEEDKKIEKQLTNLLLGKKVNITTEEYEAIIDELIEKVKKLSGNGIILNVYASEENIEKINMTLPDESIVDIDLLQDGSSKLNSNQSYIKLTYLAKDNETSEKNGFSLEINKESANASTKLNAEYCFIENEKINKKLKVNLKTEGTINSKEFKNDIVITQSDSEGETQIAIDNQIKFAEVSDLPGLNSENCIYLDLLPEEERKNLLDTIKTQLTTLYTSKKENLSFIDTNTYSQTTLENQVSTQTKVATREEAKEALINKVSIMMQEAIDRGEEFTIQNLRDLEIEGYKVSAAVTQEAALIVVDVYKFNIDTGFTLTDVE